MGKLAANILKTARVGKHSDGAGLYLLVTGRDEKSNAKGSWIFRYTYLKQRYEMGIGSIQSLSLARARAECDRWRDLMNDRRHPVNPIDEKRRLEDDAVNQRGGLTLADVAPLAFEAIKGGLKDDGNAGRWYSPLRLYVLPSLGKIKVEDIHQRDIERTLKPIWQSKAPTAKKALNRLGLVLKHAAAMGLEVNSNAVSNARQLLGDQRHKVKHHPALDLQDVRELYQWLDPRITSQRALMLYILIGGGARLGPVRTARQEQFSDGVWLIEGEGMKGRKGRVPDFRIPITREMQRLIEWPAHEGDGGYLFPSPKSRKDRSMAISDQAIENVMRDREVVWEWREPYRPHGLRASFRTWASEVDPSLYAVAETSLAHRVGSIVERTYDRNDFLEQRRVLMEQWADYLIADMSQMSVCLSAPKAADGSLKGWHASVNENSGTYLRIFEDDGSWITRPDYMLLAAMSEPDLASVDQMYSAMLSEDEFNPKESGKSLSNIGLLIKSNFLEREKYLKDRVYAGQVVLELARLASATRKPPTVNAARKLVLFNLKRNGAPATEVSIRRDIEKRFSKFRGTAHFQAVAVLYPDLLTKIEGSVEATLKFLGLARSFEQFIDANVVSESFPWTPVRVPHQIQVINDIDFIPLSKQELRAAGVS